MDEQLELDELTAKEAIKVYLGHFAIPERTGILEHFICELNEEI